MIKRTIVVLALAGAACAAPKVPTSQIRAHAAEGHRQINQEAQTPHPSQP